MRMNRTKQYARRSRLPAYIDDVSWVAGVAECGLRWKAHYATDGGLRTVEMRFACSPAVAMRVVRVLRTGEYVPGKGVVVPGESQRSVIELLLPYLVSHGRTARLFGTVLKLRIVAVSQRSVGSRGFRRALVRELHDSPRYITGKVR